MDDAAERALKKRTLTRLYNERPTWLQDAHRLLDEAVFAAYGWDPAMTDKELLALVLERNLTSHKEPSRVPNVNPIQPELPILRPVVPKPSVHPAKHREPKAPRMLKAALAAKRRGQKKKAS